MRHLLNLMRSIWSVSTNHFADFSASEAGAKSQTPLGIDSAALEKGRLICACAVNTIRAGIREEDLRVRSETQCSTGCPLLAWGK